LIHHANQILDGDEATELPDTPAPVFAARALKSAIFGVPDPQDDETFYEGEDESEDIAAQDPAKGMSDTCDWNYAPKDRVIWQ
jgi:hypothetical protein